MEWEIREIDAWGNKQDGYEWNTSYHVGDYTSDAKDQKRALRTSLTGTGSSLN